MTSEKIKGKSQPPAPGHHVYLGAASIPATKTGKPRKFHPLDSKPLSSIDETVIFWTKRTGKTLSKEEAEQSIRNIINFFKVVGEWDDKARKTGSKPMKEI